MGIYHKGPDGLDFNEVARVNFALQLALEASKILLEVAKSADESKGKTLIIETAAMINNGAQNAVKLTHVVFHGNQLK